MVCDCPTCKVFEHVTAASRDEADRITNCAILLGRSLRGQNPITIATALQFAANTALSGRCEPMGPKPTVTEGGRA